MMLQNVVVVLIRANNILDDLCFKNAFDNLNYVEIGFDDSL
jgi:hypothetical protein